jgi:hypothetical protein
MNKMPHERKESAEAEAKAVGIDKSQVTNSEAGYFIAPQGIKSEAAKKVYADNRAAGMSKETAAKIAWSVEKKIKGE